MHAVGITNLNTNILTKPQLLTSINLISPSLYLKTNARNHTSHIFNALYESFYFIPLGCLSYWDQFHSITTDHTCMIRESQILTQIFLLNHNYSQHDSNITIFISQNKCKESNFSYIQWPSWKFLLYPSWILIILGPNSLPKQIATLFIRISKSYKWRMIVHQFLQNKTTDVL